MSHSHHNHQEHEIDATINHIVEHHYSVKDEILCHLPYAILSVAISMIVLSFLPLAQEGGRDAGFAHRLFHNFHFLHLLFAGTGTMLTFRKYSKSLPLGIAVGFLVPAFFCSLSDAILPYFGGQLFGLDMHFHWCFFQHLSSVLPFLIIGMINGWIMSSHKSSKHLFYSVGFHFFHIFISSMASILYLVSYGFYNWWQYMGLIFMYMIVVVLIPCTLADIVVPMVCAKFSGKKV